MYWLPDMIHTPFKPIWAILGKKIQRKWVLIFRAMELRQMINDDQIV